MMYGSPFAASSRSAAYAELGVQTGVAAADPHQLILMLFDGALMCIAAAKQKMAGNDISGKGESLSKAIDIIANGLKASLNMEVGGALAERLSALYDYMTQRLLHANLRNDQAALDEVRGLLKELKDAWEQIGTAAVEAQSR